MSHGSPAELIPFTRFLERRQRLHGIAAAKGTVVMPAPTDKGIWPGGTGAGAADASSPCNISATVSAEVPPRGMGIV